MNLLLITDTPPYPPHKLESGLIYYLARELVQRRYKIDLACFFAEPEDHAEVPRYARFFGDIALLPKPSLDDRMLKDRQKDRHITHAEQAWSPEMWQAIQALCQERHYDFIQVVGGLPMHEFAPIIRQYPNMMITPESPIARTQEALAHKPHRRDQKTLNNTLTLLQDYQTWMYDPFAAVGAFTASEKNTLSQPLGEKAFQAPYGVDVDYYIPTDREPRQPALLFVGDYGRPTTLEAALLLCKTIFPLVSRAIPETTLYLVGANPPDALRAFESPKVVITGFVPDLRPYFELATVFLSPLSRPLGLQQDILKALTMMTPVIATSHSLDGLALVDEEEVLLAKNSDEFIRLTLQLLRQESQRARLRHGGRKKVLESYAWSQVATRYEALYQRISHQF